MSYVLLVSRFEKEMAAFERFHHWCSEAKECRVAYHDAGLTLPEPLKRFFGEEAGTDVSDEHARVIVPPLRTPTPFPIEMTAEWIWIDIGAMQAENLTLGVLRGATAPMTPTAISEAATKMGAVISKGTVSNVGTRLAGKGVERDEEGWRLAPRHPAPVLLGGYAWGPSDIFEAIELASHRRMGIVHLLRLHSDGMQVAQIAHALLDKCPWMKAPVTKDAVKADMLILNEQGLASRVSGTSGRWRATPM